MDLPSFSGLGRERRFGSNGSYTLGVAIRGCQRGQSLEESFLATSEAGRDAAD
jgi:hypothetical protein